jgi:hypothetical protein
MAGNVWEWSDGREVTRSPTATSSRGPRRGVTFHVLLDTSRDSLAIAQHRSSGFVQPVFSPLSRR